MKTTQQRAEAAAKEIEEGTSETERYTEIGVCAIIARHYAGLDALRDAAERAEKWFAQERFNREILVKSLGKDVDAESYTREIANELTSLRAALLDLEGKNL